MGIFKVILNYTGCIDLFKAIYYRTRFKFSFQPVIIFGLPSIGELQFLRPTLKLFLKRNLNVSVWVAHSVDTRLEFERLLPEVKGRIRHVKNKDLRIIPMPEVDLYMTTEQYLYGVEGAYSICLFHGLSTKGVTFTPSIVDSFDAFFMHGPVHLDTYEKFFLPEFSYRPMHDPKLFKTGYPKSDALLNGEYSRNTVLTDLELDIEKKTILYAPAFNEGASLRTQGLEIIKKLASMKEYNVICKLPVDCWEDLENTYATGGVDWFKEINNIEKNYDNLCLYKEMLIDPVLNCADILVTCISSVSFEFFAISRPVIFIDTPCFFQITLQKMFQSMDTERWQQLTTVNGGREFGTLIQEINELPEMIEKINSNYENYPLNKKKLESYLYYNKGKGSVSTVEKIEELMKLKVKTKRQYDSLSHILWVRISNYFLHTLGAAIRKVLLRYGYDVLKVGCGYIDAKSTIAEASRRKMSACEYIESTKDDERKKGRRDRVIAEIKRRGLLDNLKVILEIGPGTGMYMEKILESTKLDHYEIYETDTSWLSYLKEELGSRYSTELLCRSADGKTLKSTPSNSCQFVHAHAVFVYTPFFNTFSYIREAARVLSSGGYLFFDCLLDSSFSNLEVDSWLNGPWQFPVITSEALLMRYTKQHGLVIVDGFKEIYGSGEADYLIFKKL